MFKLLISDSKRKLNKFLIVTILFFISVLLACPFGHAFDGPGLYKDGEKVIGFDLAPSDEADIALNATKTMAEEVDRKKKVLPENMADADSFSEQKNYIKTLLECKELVTTIKEKLEQGKNIDEESDLLVKKGKDLVQANLEIIRKFNEIERECQERGYSQTILDRHAQMVREHKEGVRELLRLLKNFEDHGGKEELSEKIEKLYKFFSNKKFKEDPPLVNAQALPVNIMRIEAPVVQAVEQEAPVDIRQLDPTFEKEGLPAEVKSEKTPVIQKDIQIKDPGDIDISAGPPTQDDLDPTIDVQFTQDITDLANSLNNSPLKMYEYVKNNFEFEPYLGSRKGSQETLNHRSGNDYDLSSLLIALFRVSNIPARYATGIVEMTPDRAKNWLGVEDAATAAGILTTAGMEGVNIMDGPEVVAIQCRRVWVEAYIPYTNYRGIGNDGTGKMWVPMDPAFKQYDYQAGIDIPEEMGFDAEAFVNDYISTFHEDSPVELYKQQIIDYLAVNYPDLPYEDILRTRSLRDEVFGIIPGSLLYKLVSRDGEYSEIASDKRYQIRFHIHGSGSTLDYTANLPEIAGKQVTISYIGATAADQQVIDDSGGIYGVLQPWLVNLKPVLKVDGCDVAIGSGQVTMGIKQDSDMYFTPPTGAQNVVPAVYNKITAGSYQGIGIDTWNVVTNFFAPMSTSCEESYTGYLLHDTAMKYLGRVDASNNEVGKTMQIVVMNDVAEAIVEHVVDVSHDLWGAPLTFEWSGLIVDADRSITGSFSVTGDDETCEFMRLTGADGSNLENRIFEDGFDEPAVSTIKILELASDMSIPIYEFDGTPCSTIYSSLNQPSHVEDAICTAVTDGHVVTIPRDPITYYDWTGTGYIDMEANCAAGYIISGGRSGGATVKEWDIDMSGVYCIRADIEKPANDAPDDSAIFSAQDTSYLVFEADIYQYDEGCNHLNTINNKKFSTEREHDSDTSLTIKEIADTYGGGIYTFFAGSWGDSCPSKCGHDQRKIYIVKADLELEDVSETDEEDPGGVICLNNDDDDGNSQPDRDQNETSIVTGEDDLKSLKMIVESIDFHQDDPAGITKVTLKRSNANVRIWRDGDKSGGPILVADLTNTWYFSNAASKQKFVEAKNNLFVEGYEPGTSTITLEYKKENDTVVEIDMVKVTVVKAEFDHNKVNTRNLTHPEDDFFEYDHSVAVVWNSSETFDFKDFLTADSLAFTDYVDWYVNGTKHSSSVYNYEGEPGNNEIKDYAVEVKLKGTSTVCDRLIVVVVPRSTLQSHNDWFTLWSVNTAWLAGLPAAYSRLGTGNTDPEPTICSNQYWEGVGSLFDHRFYHPGATFQMRSEEIENSDPNQNYTHGHQACYTAAGFLRTSGVTAGSADRSHYTNMWPFYTSTSHVALDVLPYVRAAQLDGNPVWVNDAIPTNFNRPMMHEGNHLQQYLQVRPPIPNSKPLLSSDICGP